MFVPPLLLATLVFLLRSVDAAYSTASCDGLTSCSPAECTVNSEADCSFNTNTPNWASAMSTLSCKTCTQSTTSFCSSLATTLKTQNSHIKAAWCNDEFLVVAADGIPNYDVMATSGTQWLHDIPLPPGGDTTCRVRTAAEQLNVFKVPLTPTQLASGSNTVPNPLPNVPGMPAAGAVAVGIDGVPMFPNYNNRGIYAWTSCEVDRCNAHSGKGEDYHYHGDPFGSNCLYSEADYGSDPGTAHPPIIGFSFDGFVVYGRYTRATQPGQDIPLDACGGHYHLPEGYHYHPEVETATTNSLDGTQVSGSVSYTAYKTAPMECWKGDISGISNFWNSGGSQVQYDSTKDGLSGRNDLEQLRPCCGMTQYYAASGVTPVTDASATPPPTASSGSGGTCDYGTCGDGNDNSGKKCPPDFGNGKPDCPPGCTAVPSTGCSSSSTPATPASTSASGGGSPSSSTAFTWTTTNTMSYMCPSSMDTSARTIVCAQTEYPAGQNEGTTATLTCGSGNIECFVFAAVGKVGGSCGGDEFLEDPGGEFASVPVAATASCVGQASCTIEATDGALNGAAYTITPTPSLAKAKFLAVCSSTGAPSPTPATSEGMTSAACACTPLAFLVALLLCVGAKVLQ